MLTRLKIRGFKSIRQETEIELGKVNLFIGGNGVGKSNILEAVGILSACFSADITANELQKKGVRLSVPTLFKSSFKNHDLRANFDFNAKWNGDIEYDVSISAGRDSENLEFFSEHLKTNGKKIIGRSPHGFSITGGIDKKLVKDLKKTRGLWDRFQDIIPITGSLQSEISSMAAFAVYSPQTAFLRGTDIESVQVKPMGLNGGGLANAAHTVISALNKGSERADLFRKVLELVWSPGWADRIMVKESNSAIVSSQVKTPGSTLYFRDKYMNSSRPWLSAYDSSEGTLYLLFIAVLLLHPEAPKVFALDNVDNALNPSLTRKVLETVINVVCGDPYRSQGIGPEQIFFTSHNPTSLDAFDLFDDNQRIFVVTRDEQDGSTKVTRLNPSPGMRKADWIREKNGKNLSELWIEGRIKGALGK